MTILDEWKNFNQHTSAANTSPRVQATRETAFYAGAYSVLSIISNDINECVEWRDFAERFNQLSAECSARIQQIIKENNN